MTATYVQEGRHLTVTAAADQAIGDVVIIGDIVGVATQEKASGATDQVIDTKGVFAIAKDTSTAFSVGDKVYFSTDDSICTAVDTDTLIGVCVKAELAAATTVRVKIG